MGPMSLISYNDARPWARSIRDRVPGDRAYVHHAVVTVIDPGGNQPLGAMEVMPPPQDNQKGHATDVARFCCA